MKKFETNDPIIRHSALKEYKCMQKLSLCEYAIQIHDIYYWEVESLNDNVEYIIWIKLDLAEKSLQDDIDKRIKEKRPYKQNELLRILSDVL